jgi:hypothetical protein
VEGIDKAAHDPAAGVAPVTGSSPTVSRRVTGGGASLMAFPGAPAGTYTIATRPSERSVFDRFSQEQIGPFSQQAGITDPPETTYRDVHNHLPHS